MPSLQSSAPSAVAPPVFPEPRVPKNPVLGWAAFRRARSESGADRVAGASPNPAGELSARPPPTLLDLPHIKWVTSARIAIALALRIMKIGKGDEVLVPDYHCLSMVEPVEWSGATPRFYVVDERLEVVLDELANADLSRVKAMLVTHFFGYPQPMRAISAFCEARGIRVIEDCAHAIFGSVDGRPIGSWGDFAAGSLMKFFPVYDGGCLASARFDLTQIELKSPSSRFQAKSLLNSLERGLRYDRFPGVQSLSHFTLRVKDALWASYKRARFGPNPGASVFQDSAASEGTSGLDVRWLDRSMSMPSRWLIRMLPIERVVEQRRHHYRRLARELAGIPGARPLFAELPDDVVPYVFPLVVECPVTVFKRVKEAGMPLFRWELLSGDLDPARHAVALRYTTALFQIPCHQELTDADLTWMIATMRGALEATATA